MNAALGEDETNAFHWTKPKTSTEVVRRPANSSRVDHDRLRIWWLVDIAATHCCDGSADCGKCPGRNWHADLYCDAHERLAEHGRNLESFRNRLQRHDVRDSLEHHVYIGHVCGAC